MLALVAGHRASDTAVRSIARAFVNQTFPLTDEGESLRDNVREVLARNDIAWLRRNMPQLPTVENPHLRLFQELNFGPLTESEVMGRKLNVIQTHRGCSHDCEGFCFVNAPKGIVARMPYAAIVKLAMAKHRYDLKYAHICMNWFLHMRKMGLVPDDERELVKKIRAMETQGEFLDFVLETAGLYDRHPISEHLRLWPIKRPVDLPYIWKYYERFLPVLFSSFQNDIITFNASDPVEYADPGFRHEDGAPADFGDVYGLLDSYIRPVFVSTAGWLESNRLVDQSMRRIVDHNTGKRCDIEFRLTIKRYERLARTNPPAYLHNLKRMLKILWPLLENDSLRLSFYYDPRVKGDKAWAKGMLRKLDAYAKSTFGQSIQGISGYFPVSHYAGRAYDPEIAETEWHVDGTWGYEVCPDGKVTWREEGVLVERADPNGGKLLWLESPTIAPADTGVKLW